MVISLAWNSQDTRYLRLHIGDWEQRPFTGTVVTASWPQPAAGKVEAGSPNGNLCWATFQAKRLTAEMFRGPMEDLKQTRFTTSKDNFLQIVSFLPGGHFDWFDEERWQTVLHNTEMLAGFAKQGGMKGLLLDFEEYGCAFWSWGGSRPKFALKNFDTYKDKTWQQTRDLVRQRGRSYIKAVNRKFPGCLIWTLYGYSYIALPAEGTDLSDSGNGLYAAFLDGMLEASDEGTIFVDGCERAYRMGSRHEFMRLRKVVTEKALKYTMVPEAYRKKMRVGFGLYMDMYNYPANHPWYADRPQENYRTPDYLETSVRNAIEVSDGYVWIYNEFPSWWLDGPEASFGQGVLVAGKIRAANDPGPHSWIPRVYWRSLNNAQTPLRVPEGFRAKENTVAEQYTNTGYALEIIHEKTGMPMVFIPAGNFQMGAPDTERNRTPAEVPAHAVQITRPFYLGKYEVTQAQWVKIMGKNPMDEFKFAEAEPFKGDDLPVLGRLSWDDCQSFVSQAGDRLRLPTEAEWEYACRAGTQTAYSFGDDSAKLDEYAWVVSNAEGKTHPVGEKLPNPWGLHDMYGNVFERCSDWYKSTYYSKQPRSDPAGPPSGRWHVQRGGSWISKPMYCRSALRHPAFEPKYAFTDYGLRVARGL